MSIDIVTNDAVALTDSDLDEMASMGGAFDIGAVSKAKEDWVLATVARIEGRLHGFSFSTLERIGGTPCVLIGMMSVRRHSRRDQVLRGLMHEAYHRALMAFPDEDVVIGSRFVAADALDGFKELDEVTPSPGSRAVGEERAWGRRLAKRFARRAGVRRKDVHRHRQRAGRVPRLRVVETGEDRRRPQGDVRSDPCRRRLADRLRVDDG